jgi:hypothetical protein
MKFSFQKKGLTIFFFFTIFLSIALVLLYIKNETFFIKETALLCHKNTINEQRSCFEKKILARTRSNPESIKSLFNTLWDIGTKGELSYDMRLFSPIIHDVGMQLVETGTPLERAISLCPLSFRGGCVHGVIMEYLDDKEGEKKYDWSHNICEPFKNNLLIYKNCFHALGHEFTAKTKGTLNDVLSLCDSVPHIYQVDCHYGVLMEFSKGETGTGRHLETPVGKVESNCENLKNEFKVPCSISIGFYAQYEADSEPLQNTYEKCLKLPDQERRYCFQGISSALLFSQAMNQEKAFEMCLSLSKEVRQICEHYLAK